MKNSNIFISVTLENDFYTIISSKPYSGFDEIEINKKEFYKSISDNLDILSQETVDTVIYIFTDTYSYKKIMNETDKIYNVNIYDSNFFFLCRSNLIFELYDLHTIIDRIKSLDSIDKDSEIDETDKNHKLKDMIPFLVNSNKMISYLGSNKQYIKNVINPENYYKIFMDKPIINPFSLNVFDFEENFTLSDSENIKKLTYIMDIYEGIVGIKNLVIDNEIISRLNMFRNLEDDEYLYVPFTFLRYLFNQNKITNLEFDSNIIIGTKMYIDFRDIFDIADARIFSTTMMMYMDFYFIMSAIEVYKDNLATIDLNVLEFYTTNNIESPIFIEKDY